MKLSQLKTQQGFKCLLIRLQKLQLREEHTIRQDEFVYFSFGYGEKMHFSSVMDANVSVLSDDIIIPLNTSEIPEFIELQRWQSHMIQFIHEVDLGDLKTRTSTKKTLQTKANQILYFMITVLNDDEIKFGNKLIRSISQHYLVIESFMLKNKQANADNQGPSYFIMRTSQTDYVMPIIDGEICIKLPETIEFQYIKNGQIVAQSQQLKTDDFTQSNAAVDMQGRNGNPSSQLNLQMRWGINLFQAKAENTLLLQAHQIFLYNMQVKLQNVNDNGNTKIKFIYGNKSFELSGDFNSSKIVKIKRIIYFMIKSEDEEIHIIVEKNLKVVAQSRFFTDQITSHTVSSPKRKFLDNNGKIVGYIKFKCEKAKSLSTPNNNKFWKQCNKKKVLNTILLSIEQISVNYMHNEPVSVVIKTETEERTVQNVPNFQYFNKNSQISCIPVVVSSKPDENVYLMVKNASINEFQQQPQINPNIVDFIGIAILNFSTLKVGMNSVHIPFFKNQNKTVEINCLINKIPPYSFIKSSFQPQLLLSHSHKTFGLSVFMKKVAFSPYFFTYRYENKNEVYCIVEVNRLKKVLIMENIQENQLVFTSTSSSDILNFVIEDTEFIKIKIIFLVSDIGHEEQIYGTVIIKLKTQQLLAAGSEGIPYNKLLIKNDFGTVIGAISAQVIKGNMGKSISNSREKLQNSRVSAAEEEAKKQYFANSPVPPEIEQQQKHYIREENKQQITKIGKSHQNTGPFKSDLKKIQNDLNKVNYNMEEMEKSLQKKSPPQSHKSVNPIRNHIRKAGEYKKSSIRYDNSIQYGRNRNNSLNFSPHNDHQNSLVLPSIKNGSNSNSNTKNTLKQMIQMMKIRKKNNKGGYQQSTIKSYPNKRGNGAPLSERYKKKDINGKAKLATDQNEAINISREKIQKQNPNMQKNMQLLFPKKHGKGQKADKSKGEDSNEKLKGLKSVYKEIGQDMGDIEPSVKDKKEEQKPDMKGPEWDDNQFAIPS